MRVVTDILGFTLMPWKVLSFIKENKQLESEFRNWREKTN